MLIGMKYLLRQVIPIMQVETFPTYRELAQAGADSFFHFFVSQSELMAHRDFYEPRRHKTIVLTPSAAPSAQPAGFHCLCYNQSEKAFVHALLAMEQTAHSHGKNLPPMPVATHEGKLTRREIDVLKLLVQGCINKEIADRLNIALTTVITHRKNIVAKLGLRSVSALTIYAVMHGYVDIDSI